MVPSTYRSEKRRQKKAAWTPEEDQKLIAYIEKHGHKSWKNLPNKAGLQRCGKSCRLRWTNYLRPDIKRGEFSLQEEKTIIHLHAFLGNKWSVIATHLPKRTDNEIKNYWNTHIKKRLDKMGIDPLTHKPKTNTFGPITGATANSKEAAILSHVAQWESTRLEAEARLSFLSATNTAAAPAATSSARPKFLDVLKAWEGMVSDMFFHSAAAGNSLQSSNSTLNFIENGFTPNNPLIIPQFQFTHSNNNNNNIPCKEQIIDQEMNDILDPFVVVHGISMDVENTSIDHQISSSSMAGENATSDYWYNYNINLDQDQNDYWNSIFNLVDSQAAGSGSMMF